jgi:ankyrin repeat protein
MTALMEAAAWGYLPVVEALLEKGADLEIKNKEGQTAWLLAAMGGHTEIVELFRKTRGTPVPPK